MRTRLLVILGVMAFVAAACGSDDGSVSVDSAVSASPAATMAVEDGADAVDLTDQVLSSTDPSCASYAGSYTSMITDLASGQDFEGMFTISAGNGTCSFATNQIPNHDTGENAGFRDTMSENDAVLEVSSDPVLAAGPIVLGMDANVIMLNGVKWEAYPAACFDVGGEALGREAIGCGPEALDNPWRYNIGSPLNDFGFDTHLACLQPGGLYHYHSTPSVLYDIECEGTEVSPVIGFAADGFPVFGPCFEDAEGNVRAAQSSYVVREGVRQGVDGYTTPYIVGNVVSEAYDGAVHRRP